MNPSPAQSVPSARSGSSRSAVALFVALALLLGWRMLLASEGGARANLAGAHTLFESPRFTEHLPPGSSSTEDRAERSDLQADEKATIALFKQASPAVVNISNLAVRRNRVSLNESETLRGTGSGFVWDADGHVVTNFHVIAGGNRFRVTLSDGSNWDATVVGAAPSRDVAVLRVEAPHDRLPSLAIGTSSNLAVGQKVFAIGNPFGLDQTLTTGIISGLGREIRSLDDHRISDVIQTDAAINPGNSGGPLLDSSGLLIGMNTAIVSPSGAYAGIGFAVPVDSVRRVVPELIRRGRVTRPGLGITPASNYVAQRLGVSGVVVLDVADGSSAGKAGLRPAREYEDGSISVDVLVAIDDHEVRRVEDLFDYLDQKQVGDEVALTVQRGDKRERVRLRLQALED
jgi:S1-C subfamily serine protease